MPGAVPASPSDVAPSGSVACLRTPVGEVGVRTLQPLGDRARDRFDLRFELGVDSQLDAGDAATSSTVRSSCVGPSPPETATRSAPATASAQRRSELAGVVADDLDPRGLDAEGEQRAREEGAVQVGAVAAHELAARDDDHRARASAQEPVRTGRLRRCASP